MSMVEIDEEIGQWRLVSVWGRRCSTSTQFFFLVFLFFSFFSFFFSSHLTWKRLTLKSVANDGWNIPSAAAVSCLLLLLMSTRISVQPIDMVSCIGNSISCCNIHLLLSNIGLLCGIQWYSKAVALMPRTLSIYHPSMAIPLVIIQIYLDINRSQNMVGKFFFSIFTIRFH